jgi:phosphoribosylglycinamide formyltransferase-1
MAIYHRIQTGELNADIAVVISNLPSAAGLEFARSHGIPTHVFEVKNYESATAYEADIIECLRLVKVDLVVLAGYMKLVGDPMITAFEGRMVNIHPSLLPSFKGLNAQQQALDYGVKITGCTAHYVVKEMDAGPIILQAAVPVADNDTVVSLSQRILDAEHAMYYKAIHLALLNLGGSSVADSAY